MPWFLTVGISLYNLSAVVPYWPYYPNCRNHAKNLPFCWCPENLLFPTAGRGLISAADRSGAIVFNFYNWALPGQQRDQSQTRGRDLPPWRRERLVNLGAGLCTSNTLFRSIP